MAEMQELIGQSLGQYEIRAQIGEGGMATVFKAYQPGLNREVAVKVLPPYVAMKPGFAERFAREAQAIGNLHHQNILPVHDSGQDKGYGYLVMRYVPKARTLADVMGNELSSDQIIELTRQISGALDHAHQAGIIHRDIKPSNILMDGNWVLLSDFGLAKMVEGASELTGTGVGIGTPSYMSPEQAKAETIDHRTDIYSLGVILFEMMTGQVPHKAETPLATVLKRINDPLPRPRSLNPDISEAVEAVLLKTLAVDPNDRYDSAGQMSQALKAAYSSPSPQKLLHHSEDDSLEVPLPSQPRQARLEQSEPAVDPVPVEKPQPRSDSLRTVEIVVSVLLGIIAMCGVAGFFLAFTSNSDTGELNIALAPACLGMAFAGATSIALIWVRNRSRAASAWLAAAIACWFIGLNILGWGGFAVLDPGDNTFVENLGFSLALCFVPGGFLAVLGLAFYFYDYRLSQRAEASNYSSSLDAVPGSVSRADKLKRAVEYRRHITQLIKQQNSALGATLAPVLDKLDQWEAYLRQLSGRLDAFEKDKILQRDMVEVPHRITQLQAQLDAETNPRVQAEIRETLARYQHHQEHLESLRIVMRKTELDIDETLAAMGTVYSQLQLVDARKVDSSRARRLSADIEEEANRLSDLVAAMDDVYEVTSSFDRTALE